MRARPRRRTPGRVPDFCLPDEAGAPRCLHDLVAQGPVLLWLFRGHR